MVVVKKVIYNFYNMHNVIVSSQRVYRSSYLSVIILNWLQFHNFYIRINSGTIVHKCNPNYFLLQVFRVQMQAGISPSRLH